LARPTGGLGVVGPVSPSNRGARRPRRPGAPEFELVVKAKAWAEETAKDQGLPSRVEDSTVIGEVAILLASGRAPVHSGAPDRLDAAGVESVPAPDGRIDDDAGEHGADDGPLPGRVEVRPLRPERAGVADEPAERRGA
jgi:hypothetical protein